MSKGPDITRALERIRQAREAIPSKRSLLVAISGIDGSGKGYVSAKILAALENSGYRTAGINIDGWLNLPTVRFGTDDPPGHFYAHAIRFEEMFSTLVLPLRDNRSVKVEAEHAEETAGTFQKKLYAFDEVDIVVLEGIFLFQQRFMPHYDLAFWVECSFDTALRRAIARGQEGLPAEETIRAYRTIYFPAQEIHFRRDNPQAAATETIGND